MNTVPGKIALSDVPANRRRGGELRVVLGPRTTGAVGGFMGVVTLEPGEFINEHYHPYSEEFLYAVAGTITVHVDGSAVVLTSDEGIMVPKNARHRVVNNSDQQAKAVFHLCPLAPRPELGHVDTEPQPGAQK